MFRQIRFVVLTLFLTAFCCSCCPCRSQDDGGSGSSADSVSADIHRLPDTLRVATLYSPTSYFLYRDAKMGYDYDLVKRLAADKKMALDLTIAKSLA